MINTTMPAKIISYDGKRASVKPSIPMMLASGDYLDAPDVMNVPVCQYYGSGGDILISFPYKKGDDVWLHVSQRSIDEWRSSPNSSHPKDPRQYDLSDAYITPVMHPLQDPVSTEAIVIKYGSTKMEVKSGGVSIQGDLTVSGNIKGSDVVAGLISLKSHWHTATPNTVSVTTPIPNE